ncbi:MAG: TIM44-like domain-containing protein [Sterolibacterium sp.]
MKTFTLMVATLVLGLTLTTVDAEAARRMGTGKSIGMQRQMTPPAQGPGAASGVAKGSGAAAAPQAQPNRSWMGPIAGLAAGLGLAALASHFGFGEELASMLMIGLVVMAVMIAVGLIMRRRAASRQPAMAGVGGMQYAASGADQIGQISSTGSGARAEKPATQGIPSDFDVDGFVRNAKVNFIRLQAANDACNIDEIRNFTTPEMFAELKMNFSERGNVVQETEVVSVDANVIEVLEEDNRYVVSVRYSGLIREDKDGPVESIEEIWHLIKSRDGESGWLLAGIQQIQ